MGEVRLLMKPYSLSVKTIIRDPDGNILLLRRKLTSGANAGKWDFPGGKIDPDESFYEALLREVREETGLEIEVERVADTAESENAFNRIAYLIFDSKCDEPDVMLSDEHIGFAWVSPDEIGEYDVCPQFTKAIERISEK